MRHVLAISLAAASLPGCGALNDAQPPIGAARGAMPATSTQYNVLFRFKGGANGEHPGSGLIDVNGTLYGTTYEGGSTGFKHCCGTVYGVTTSGAEKTLHAFHNDDGRSPLGDLIDVNGTLYGTTYLGGAASQGTFYRVSLRGKEKVLLSFNIYTNSSGAYPAAGLIDEHGTLYGTTVQGCTLGFGEQCGPHGSTSVGVVYSVTTTGRQQVLYSFGDNLGAGGEYPYAPVIDVNGTLYGTTRFGGSDFGGIVYSVSSSSGGEAMLHSFTGGSDGKNPVAGLLDVNGTLYGTTLYGGGSSACAKGCGTVFSISTSGAEKVLHSFAGGSDGAYPQAALIDMNGTLYGTTAAGGGASGCAEGGCGTIFSISTSGAESVVHSFSKDSNGWEPHAELLDVSGTLYGTTFHGGLTRGKCPEGCGTVFSFVP
jgi:uncharacterized repeat protein (TIGR03803 family)